MIIDYIKIFERNEMDYSGEGICKLENARDICITKAINGDYGLSFSLNPADEKYQYLENEKICFIEGQAYRIKVIEKEKITCEHIYTDAARCHIQSTSSVDLVNQKASYLMQEIFVKPTKYGFINIMTSEEVAAIGMEWVGENDEDNKENMDLFVQSKVTPIAALKTLMENYDKHKIHTELYVDNRNVALVKQIGKDTDIKISLRKNAKDMSSVKDSSELVTRLYLYGKDDLHIGSVEEKGNQYIDSPDIDSLGIYEGFMQFDNIDDPKKLYEAGLKQFADDNPDRIDRCKYTVTIDPAFTDEEIGLGDTVIVEDEDFRCQTRQRVISQEIYPFEPNRNTITVGTPPKTVSDTFAGLIEGSVKTEINTNSRGEIKTGWLEMMQHNEKISIDKDINNKEIAVYKTGALFESEDGTDPAAVAIINGKLAIATGRDDNGNWEWTTIMDSGKVVVNEVYSGELTLSDDMTIKSSDGKLVINKNSITIYDSNNKKRAVIGNNGASFVFSLYDPSDSSSPVFRVDEDGDLLLTGKFETGDESEARIKIDGNGLISYGANKVKNGFYCKPGDVNGEFGLYVDDEEFLSLKYMSSKDNGLVDFDAVYLYVGDKALTGIYNVGSSEPIMTFFGNVSFSGEVDFGNATIKGINEHDHGVPNGTWLATANGGTIEFTASRSITTKEE